MGARHARAVSFVLLLGTSALAVQWPAHAQTAADRAEAARQADIIQRQNLERMQREMQSVLPADRAPSGIDTRELEPKVDASAAGKKCHDITTIRISGAPNLSPEVREQIEREFSKSCLGVVEIEKILAEITRDYISRGYVTTRAYLPQQDLSKGTLEILVLEGVVDKIMLEDGEHNSIRLGTVFPRAGDILNLRDFEQGVEQVNKLSSNNAMMDIQPGDKAGTSSIVIRNQPGTPFHASFSGDNQGSESTGRQQYAATLMSDRLLGLNELLLYTHRRSHPHDEERQSSESDSLSVVTPFGYSTVSLSMNRSRYTSTIVAPSGLDLQFRGESATDSLRLERVMLRDRTTRVTFASMLTVKDSKSWLAGQYLGISSRDLSVLDLDASVSTGVAGGVLNLDFGLAKGLRFAGALSDADNLPHEAPRAQFEKFKYGIGYSIPFRMAGKDFSFSTQATGQHAMDTLYGSEQILIGGIYSVRGFVRNALSGDSGYYVRNELSMRHTLRSNKGETIGVRLFTGVDFGVVRNRVADVPSGRLTGMAFGMNLNWRGASFEIFNTRPLDFPDFFTREAPQTWVRFNYAI
jgi:hemolysin activation/secretion protein